MKKLYVTMMILACAITFLSGCNGLKLHTGITGRGANLSLGNDDGSMQVGFNLGWGPLANAVDKFIPEKAKKSVDGFFDKAPERYGDDSDEAVNPTTEVERGKGSGKNDEVRTIADRNSDNVEHCQAHPLSTAGLTGPVRGSTSDLQRHRCGMDAEVVALDDWAGIPTLGTRRYDSRLAICPDKEKLLALYRRQHPSDDQLFASDTEKTTTTNPYYLRMLLSVRRLDCVQKC